MGNETDIWTFGFSLLIVGMGGTMLTLGVFSLLMVGLTKAFPAKKERK